MTDAVTVTGSEGNGLPTGSVAFFVCGPTTAAVAVTFDRHPGGDGGDAAALGYTGFQSTGTSSTFTPDSGRHHQPPPSTPTAGDNLITYGPSSDNNGTTVDTAECFIATAATALQHGRSPLTPLTLLLHWPLHWPRPGRRGDPGDHGRAVGGIEGY